MSVMKASRCSVSRWLAVAVVVVCAGPARAEEGPPAAGDAPPPNYMVALVNTTIAHRAPGGSFDGWGHDVNPAIGFGRMISDTLAVELDLSPSFLRGEYAGFSLVPGVVWAFSANFYAAARFVVPVDPELNLALSPGLGFIHSVTSAISIVAEADVFSFVGRGDPDLGVSFTAGGLYAF